MTDDVMPIILPERFDIAAVEGVHQQLEDAISQGKSVVLQADAVTRLDTAALQLLVAFHLEAQTNHIDVTWQEPSSTISQVFEFMQLGNHVGLGDTLAGAV
jgi:anti-anti-sigma regulatory factor